MFLLNISESFTYFRFSPRARGCSVLGLVATLNSSVFPACAGMFRCTRAAANDVAGFPRVRGDVPSAKVTWSVDQEFSPRARGCSLFLHHEAGGEVVFPACAGMFPALTSQNPPTISFPRVRGDVPGGRTYHRSGEKFSPRARGCSAGFVVFTMPRAVFPACAGMFLSPRRFCWVRMCFPRVRGDVPACSFVMQRQSKFSPRARGCSRNLKTPLSADTVFPACAGMFLPWWIPGIRTYCFPRVRGDVPNIWPGCTFV